MPKGIFLMNETIKNILSRRSCKSYKPDAVPAELLDAILNAGLHAASGMNKQSPIILAVTNKSARDKLSALNAKYDFARRPDPFYGAPAILAVLANTQIPTATYDGSLALGYAKTANAAAPARKPNRVFRI